jgi:hypothetical protein
VGAGDVIHEEVSEAEGLSEGGMIVKGKKKKKTVDCSHLQALQV